jgi:hypothetical protein
LTSPSDPHEKLYKRLIDITARVKTALGEPDEEHLHQLAEEHAEIMQGLEGLGFSQNPELVSLVKEVHDRVHELITAMEKRMDVVGRELALVGNRKRQIAAYSNAGRLPSAPCAAVSR